MPGVRLGRRLVEDRVRSGVGERGRPDQAGGALRDVRLSAVLHGTRNLGRCPVSVLERRLEALEETLEQPKGERRYGA